MTAEMIVDWAARGNHFRPEDLLEVRLEKPIDLREATRSGWWLSTKRGIGSQSFRQPTPVAFILTPKADLSAPIRTRRSSQNSRGITAASKARGQESWKTKRENHRPLSRPEIRRFPNPGLKYTKPEERHPFDRLGYFALDQDLSLATRRPSRIFDRTITLRDTRAKESQKG
jgi:hypothetical protein